MGFSVVMPVAPYDVPHAIRNLTNIWPIADEVIVGVDTDGRGWAGTQYTPVNVPIFIDVLCDKVTSRYGATAWNFVQRKVFAQNFYEFEVNHPKMFHFKGTDFFVQQKPAMRVQTWERNYLTLQANPANWVLQLDADEQIQDLPSFVDDVKKIDDPDCYVSLEWINVFKTFPQVSMALVVDGSHWTPFALQEQGINLIGRKPRYGRELRFPQKLLHWTIAGRSPLEIKNKLMSFGHAGEVDPGNFMATWVATNPTNYQNIQNACHYKGWWPKLKMVPISTLEPAHYTVEYP